jgi:hypothetical protein
MINGAATEVQRNSGQPLKLVIGKDSLAAEQHHAGAVTADPQVGQLVFRGGGRREGECTLDRPAKLP